MMSKKILVVLLISCLSLSAFAAEEKPKDKPRNDLNGDGIDDGKQGQGQNNGGLGQSGQNNGFDNGQFGQNNPLGMGQNNGVGNGQNGLLGTGANTLGTLPPRWFKSPQEWYQDFVPRFEHIRQSIPQQTFDRYAENWRIWAQQVISYIQTRLQTAPQFVNNPYGFQGFMSITENMMTNLHRSVHPLTTKTAKCGLQQNAFWGGVDCGQLELQQGQNNGGLGQQGQNNGGLGQQGQNNGFGQNSLMGMGQNNGGLGQPGQNNGGLGQQGQNNGFGQFGQFGQNGVGAGF